MEGIVAVVIDAARECRLTERGGQPEILELVDRPKTLGFQADMAHTLLYTMGYNAPEDAILPQANDLFRAMKELAEY